MTYTLSYRDRHTYNGAAVGIQVPVILRSSSDGVRPVEVMAKLDTGAAYCIFGPDVAEMLSLNIESGHPMSISMPNGSTFMTYGHELTFEILTRSIDAMVYFAKIPEMKRNVLGRTGFFDRVRFGLEDYDRVLYLAHYDDQLD